MKFEIEIKKDGKGYSLGLKNPPTIVSAETIPELFEVLAKTIRKLEKTLGYSLIKI